MFETYLSCWSTQSIDIALYSSTRRKLIEGALFAHIIYTSSGTRKSKNVSCKGVVAGLPARKRIYQGAEARLKLCSCFFLQLTYAR